MKLKRKKRTFPVLTHCRTMCVKLDTNTGGYTARDRSTNTHTLVNERAFKGGGEEKRRERQVRRRRQEDAPSL